MTRLKKAAKYAIKNDAKGWNWIAMKLHQMGFTSKEISKAFLMAAVAFGIKV